MGFERKHFGPLTCLCPRRRRTAKHISGTEYLAVLETRQGTPYFLNLHRDDVGHSVVLGAIGSGKSFFLCFLVAQMQKYNPFTFIFNLGGSYKTLTAQLGGTYVKIGPAPHGGS